MTDYKVLYDALEEKVDFERKDFFKPKEGYTKIKIKSEMSEPKDIQYENKTITKVFIDIEVDGVEYTWGITKGLTKNSLYGQLVQVGKERGKLTDEEITLLVKGSGKDRDYTITDLFEKQ